MHTLPLPNHGLPFRAQFGQLQARVAQLPQRVVQLRATGCFLLRGLWLLLLLHLPLLIKLIRGWAQLLLLP